MFASQVFEGDDGMVGLGARSTGIHAVLSSNAATFDELSFCDLYDDKDVPTERVGDGLRGIGHIQDGGGAVLGSVATLHDNTPRGVVTLSNLKTGTTAGPIGPSTGLFLDWTTGCVFDAAASCGDGDDASAPVACAVFSPCVPRFQDDTDDSFSRLYCGPGLRTLVSVTWGVHDATPRQLATATATTSDDDDVPGSAPSVVPKRGFEVLPTEPGASLAGRQVGCSVAADGSVLTVCMVPHGGLYARDESSSLTYWTGSTRHTDVTRLGVGPSTLIPGSLSAFFDASRAAWVVVWGVRTAKAGGAVSRAWAEALMIRVEDGGLVSRGVPTPWVSSQALTSGIDDDFSMRMDVSYSYSSSHGTTTTTTTTAARVFLWSVGGVLVSPFVDGSWCPASTLIVPVPPLPGGGLGFAIADVFVSVGDVGVLLLWRDGEGGGTYVQRIEGTGCVLDAPPALVKAVPNIDVLSRPRFSTPTGGISGRCVDGTMFLNSPLVLSACQGSTVIPCNVDAFVEMGAVRQVQLAWAQTVFNPDEYLHHLSGLGSDADSIVWPPSVQRRVNTVFGSRVATFLTSRVFTVGGYAVLSSTETPLAFFRHTFHGFSSPAAADACVPAPVLALPRLVPASDGGGLTHLPSWVRVLERCWFTFATTGSVLQEVLVRARIHAVFGAAGEIVLHAAGFRLPGADACTAFGAVLSVLMAAALGDDVDGDGDGDGSLGSAPTPLHWSRVCVSV